MSITLFLLAIVLLLVSYLFIFTLVYYYFTFRFLKSPLEEKPKYRSIDTPVSVLIPALNEADAVLKTISSLCNQEYNGRIDIYLLIEDKSDSSVPFLENTYGALKQDNLCAIQSLHCDDSRNVYIVFTGFKKKCDKLNWIIPKIETRFTGLLDADHMALPDWILSSMNILHDTPAKIVQGRRWPLSTKGIYRLWDSLQHHIGVQVFNVVYSRLNLNLFFTGTTAVFTTKILQENPFPNCITEDTYLSYKLILKNIQITNNPHSGSSEDLSPNLYSFLSRRRRWANGHTQAFFENLTVCLKSHTTWGTKLHFILHGQYYFISFLIFLFHLLIAGYLFFQLPTAFCAYTLITAFLCGIFFTSFLRTQNFSVRLAETLIVTSWFLPFITFCFVGIAYLLKLEFHYYLISVPGFHILKFVGIFSLLAPLVLLFAGLSGFKQWRFGLCVFIFLSFPIALFLDITGNLLGITDYFLRMNFWRVVSRSKSKILTDKLVVEHAVPISSSYPWKARSILMGGAVSLLFILVFNDATFVYTCGETPLLFGKPLLPVQEIPLHYFSWTDKEMLPDGKLKLDIVTKIHQAYAKEPLQYRQYFEGQLVKDTIVVNTDQNIVSVVYVSPGWETKVVITEVSGNNFNCRHVDKINTRFTEIKNGALWINGEPFLLKGMIPNFSQSNTNLSLNEGFKLIKKLGANTLRFYHEATENIISEITKEQLLYIDQPDSSTWDDTDVSQGHDRDKLVDSYLKLRNKSRGNAFSLINLIGNELEMGQDQLGRTGLQLVLGSLRHQLPVHEPLAYATPEIHSDYPLNIQAINMLTMGKHFWKYGLDQLKSQDKPFFASEFGGFQGAFERVPDSLRSYRIRQEWEQLLAAGAIGGVAFQSHDNKAQPAFRHLTDPFSFDFSDDETGLWRSNGSEKESLNVVRDIFSDFTFSIENRHEKNLQFKIVNRRNYKLSRPTLKIWDKDTLLFDAVLETIAANGNTEGEIKAFSYSGKDLNVTLDYTTHSGLASHSEQKWDQHNLFFNIALKRTEENSSYRMTPAENAEYRDVNGFWVKWDRKRSFAPRTRIRFSKPAHVPADSYLILDGFRSSEINLISEKGSVLRRFSIPKVLPFVEWSVPYAELEHYKISKLEFEFSSDLRETEFDAQILASVPQFFYQQKGTLLNAIASK